TQIAVVLSRCATIGEEQLPNFFNVASGLLDLDRRNPQAFVENFRRFIAKGSRHHPANLGDMSDTDRKAKKLAVNKEGLEKRVFRTMQPAAIGIVVENDVAFSERFEGDFLGACLDEQRHAADHRRTE